MPVNLLAICIGNTRTRLGTFIENNLEPSQIVPNTNLQSLGAQIETGYHAIASRENPRVMIASTCQPVAERVRHEVQQMGIEPIVVERDISVPIGRQLDREALVGEDRLLNAAAAYDVLRQACVVVDAGTAVTIDFVDGTGTFHGGAILPGVEMMLKALAQQAWSLPEIDMERPQEPIGHNTIEAMRSGVFYGLRGSVRELTEQYAEMAGAYPAVVATGGDAELLFDGYELVEHVVADLTLLGMKVTLAGLSPGRGDVSP